MLVIGRKAGESILIGEGVEIHIVDITPSRVKIGIVAPRETAIMRKEVKLAHEQNVAAAQAAAADAAMLAKLR